MDETRHKCPDRPGRGRSPRRTLRLVLVAALTSPGLARADAVVLKNGLVYRGTSDRDNTLVQVFDALKRIVIRDTKVAKIEPEAVERHENFPLVQPLEVHGGEMPAGVLSVKATPWDEFGRRSFQYVGPKLGKPVRMTQAIRDLGPKVINVRGVDGFWKGYLPTSQVPKASVLAILAKADQKNKTARLSIGRFLIQAEWYPEALAELDSIARDFPDMAETVKSVKAQVRDLDARRRLVEIESLQAAQRPKEARARLKAFPTEGTPADVLVAVRDQVRLLERRDEADRSLADALRRVAAELPPGSREIAKGPLVAMLQDLTDAPDAVRDRFTPFQKALADGSLTPDARFARALSGWLTGPEGTLDDLAAAAILLQAKDALKHYLVADSAGRLPALETLRGLILPDPTTKAAGRITPATLVRLAQNAPPPARDPNDETPGQPKLLRVRDDINPQPTEYMVLLPEEYHPLRAYPTIVALHGNQSSEATPSERMKVAIAWWAGEASKRGYIVIAPDYMTPNLAPDYRYSASEHAAVELALRDARRRFSIDSDRVYLGGQLMGGNMAWDFGLAHPDLFAGVAIVSGLPAKYVWSYKDHAKRVPIYAALGDLAPAEPDVFFPFAKRLISSNYDVTYVEHFKRGLEDIPEEAGPILDWMSKHVRDPHPKQFQAVSARSSDDRFWGVVIREFASKNLMAPDAVDPMGKNLKPATLDVKIRNLANLVDISAAGVRRLDVWVGPQQVEFAKRLEIRVNGKSAFRGKMDLDIEPLLEDLRVRGDRKQIYWARIPVDFAGTRAR